MSEVKEARPVPRMQQRYLSELRAKLREFRVSRKSS